MAIETQTTPIQFGHQITPDENTHAHELNQEGFLSLSTPDSLTNLVSQGKALEISIEPELELIEEEVEVPTEEGKQDENEAYMNEIAELKESILALQSENDELKAELENLKKPADEPIKGSTLMNSNVKNDIPKEIKGSKFERAYNVFNN